MAQALTEDLLDILSSKFQAAAQGYRTRVEIDYLIGEVGVTPGEPTLVQASVATIGIESNRGVRMGAPVTPGNLLVCYAVIEDENAVAAGHPVAVTGGWEELWTLAPFQGIKAPGTLFAKIATGSDDDGGDPLGDVFGFAPAHSLVASEWAFPGGASAVPLDITGDVPGGGTHTTTGDPVVITQTVDAATDGLAIMVANIKSFGFMTLTAGGDSTLIGVTTGAPSDHPAIMVYRIGSGSLENEVDFDPAVVSDYHSVAASFGPASEEPTIATLALQPRRISIDKSRRMAASEAVVEIPNELGAIDISPDGSIKSHHPIRIYQWYGDPANEVRTFTGFVDAVREGRDKRTVTLTCRDTMKRLIVQTFSATAPQNVGEDGVVRTEANGVFLEKEADYIVAAILDQAGWPTADRDIAVTGYALDEYIISDGASWADAIIGENALTGLTGYDAWADELGVFHFRPMLATAAPDSDTEPTPDYSYLISAGTTNLESRNVLRLDHDIDDYDLKTRVKVRGNLATRKAAWTEVWHTNQFNRPVGLWDDPTDDGFLRILDRGTKKIYRMRQSDREKVGAGIWPLDISGDVTYPLGLSGDPADSDRFWVLEAAWRTGNGNAASIHKYDASSGNHLAEYSLPDGQWSDLKVSSSFIWVTNYGTDKLHKRSKADGTNITTYDGPTVNGNVQTNPTGVAVDGTTLLTFWDGKARFLLTDESDPETLDPSTPLIDGNGIISTAGSKIFGGEMDVDTHNHLFACHDELGIVWKFRLSDPDTDEVWSEVVDTDLEDELGLLSGAEDREHDTHPGDADHSFEIRRATVTLEKTITNLAQATETALRVLDELAHRRETIDFGVVGHPGHQRGDLHQLTDPVTGISALYVLDTYRDSMDERGYLGTVAYVPYDPEY